MIKSNEYMMLEDYIMGGVVKTYKTKKQAEKAASEMGWPQYHIEQVERRFERVWIVGATHIQNDEIAGMEFKKYTCPTGVWERKNGTQQMVVVEVRKYIDPIRRRA